jgi:hypothetical protein
MDEYGDPVSDFQDSSIQTIASDLRWKDMGERAVVLATNEYTGKETALTLINWGGDTVRVYFHDRLLVPGKPLGEGVHWETTKPGNNPFPGANKLTDVKVIYTSWKSTQEQSRRGARALPESQSRPPTALAP